MPQFDQTFFSSLTFWSVLSFILMLLIVRRYLLPSLTKVLDERRRKVMGDIEAAEKARKESERLLEEHRQLLAQAKGQADAILHQAEEMARVIREEKQRETLIEVDNRLKKAEAQIKSDIERVRNELKKETVSLVVRGVESVLEESLSESQKMMFINRAIRAVDTREPKKVG